MTADACRPSGYLAICPFAHSRFAGVKAKLSGCSVVQAAKHQRSTSPNTMSREPIVAATSASMWPLQR